MNDRASGVEDYVGFLRALWVRQPAQFLFGGQAVNFWAEFFVRHGPPEKLHRFRPFTSKDCDVWVSASAWKDIQSTEIGRLVCGTSPADGQLGILTLRQTPLRVVDLMSGVYGIRQNELARLCERAPVFNGVKVIDPIFLFLSKCHCLLDLDQSERQDERHVRMLALILPAYLAMLISRADDEPPGERAILKEIKLLRKILRTQACRRAVERLEIEPGSLIPWERMENCGMETLAAYASARRNRPDRDD